MKILGMKAAPLTAIALGLTVSACAPPAGFVALSGLSYASSGKGISDHAISAVSEKDCAVLRAVRGADICETRGNGDNGMLMSMIESSPGPRVPERGSMTKLDKPLAIAPVAPPVKTVAEQASRRTAAGIESIYSLPR